MGKKCLFINNISENCGIYQYGKRLHGILRKSTRHYYGYVEVSSVEEYMETVKNLEHDCVIYNYSHAYFGWLTDDIIQKEKKNICIYHEFNLSCAFDLHLNTDSADIPTHERWHTLPRPLFEDMKLVATHREDSFPIIGSFGLALPQKGFEHIVKMVNREFDNATIRFHIPHSQFGDPDRKTLGDIIDRCVAVKRKPGIKLVITSHFLNDRDLLNFLNGNDINVFMYDSMDSRGLSSVIDYALSVDRPIGVSDSSVFRHIYDERVCMYQNSISSLIKNGTSHLAHFRDLWSNKNLIEKVDRLIDENV